MNIFYCDDDLEDVEIFAEILGRIGASAKLTISRDPIEAMKLLNAVKPKPDILFFDSSMPKMDGLECVIALKRNKNLKKIPVVILSCGLQKEFIEKYNRLGVFMFIAKTDVENMEQLLRTILETYPAN